MLIIFFYLVNYVSFKGDVTIRGWRINEAWKVLNKNSTGCKRVQFFSTSIHENIKKNSPFSSFKYSWQFLIINILQQRQQIDLPVTTLFVN